MTTPEQQQQARDKLFENLKENQKEGLVKEIKDLNDATSNSLTKFEDILLVVRTADLKTPEAGTWKPQYDKTRSAYDTYKSLVGNIRSGAGSSKNILNRFIQNPLDIVLTESDEDGVIELEGFVQDELQKKAFLATRIDSTFGGVLQSLDEITKYFESTLKNAKVYDGDIAAVKEKIAALEAEKKAAAEEVKKLIPDTLKALGIDPDSPKIIILLNTAIKSLMTAIENAFKKEWKEAAQNLLQIRKLNAAVNKVLDLEKKIDEQNRELSKLAYQKGRLDEEKQRWQEVNVDVGILRGKILGLDPKLSSIAKVTDALKDDIERYLKFMHGPDAKDKSKKSVEKSNLEGAGKLYQALANALATFATTV